MENLTTGFPITQSVVDGTQQGQIFELGESTLILHKAGFASLIHEEACDYDALTDLMLQPGFPKYFHVYNASEKLIRHLDGKKELFNTRVRERCVLRYMEKTVPPIKVPNGYKVLPVSNKNFFLFEPFGLELSSRFWNGKEDFLQHAGAMGLFTSSGEPVSICYAAAIANNTAEIDIMTSPSFRNLGLGKIAAVSFIENCFEKKLTPNWDCLLKNLFSLNLANSINFQRVHQYPFLSIYRNEI